jgi:ATP-dependent RNA helicase SUPV3L1/SUV3
VLAENKTVPAGYRLAGNQLIRVDLAEKILRAAFDARAKASAAKQRNPRFRLDLALPISIGLEQDNAQRLLGSAGFRLQRARVLPEGAQGPAAPDSWLWRPKRPGEENRKAAKGRGKPRSPGKSSTGKRGKPGKKPPQKRGAQGARKPRDRTVDTGPARASGAFDKLADLLGG